MKKIILIVILFALVVGCFAGCGNMSLGLGNFTFTKIHVDTHNYSGCFTVEKWYDNSSGIEVKTKEAGSMYLAEGMYLLIEKDCPFCDLEGKDG
jgi:hypothetical protein